MLAIQGILLLLSGCSVGNIPDFQSVDTPELVSPWVETFASGKTAGAASVPPFQTLANQAGVLTLWDGLGNSTLLKQSGPSVEDALRLPDGRILIATDDGLMVMGAYLERSDLELPENPRQLGQIGSATWIGDPGALYRYQAGNLEELLWEGQAITTSFATGTTEAGLPLVWAGNSRGIVAFGESDQGWVEITRLDELVADRMAADSENRLFVAARGGVFLREKQVWRAFKLPTEVTAVVGNPEAPGVWLGAFNRLFWTDGQNFEELGDLPEDVLLPQAAVSVDEAGRLLLAGEENLYRIAHRPTIVLVGLEDGGSLSGETPLVAQLTSPETVQELSISVDGTGLEMSDLQVTLDPFQYLDGKTHTVEANARWEDGQEARSSLQFTVDSVGNATWAENVQPLYAARCSKCHGGSTQTVLDSEEAWIAKIDAILTEVTAGRMPLGGPRLSGAEISVIRAWKEGGYP